MFLIILIAVLLIVATSEQDLLNNSIQSIQLIFSNSTIVPATIIKQNSTCYNISGNLTC